MSTGKPQEASFFHGVRQLFNLLCKTRDLLVRMALHFPADAQQPLRRRDELVEEAGCLARGLLLPGDRAGLGDDVERAF